MNQYKGVKTMQTWSDANHPSLTVQAGRAAGRTVTRQYAIKVLGVDYAGLYGVDLLGNRHRMGHCTGDIGAWYWQDADTLHLTRQRPVESAASEAEYRDRSGTV
ncbi:MAG: hypothetical protein IMZ62_17240 [Chloroflexi bacterium]|nr:hypothetical protein [Chloroflexota bacterium]